MITKNWTNDFQKKDTLTSKKMKIAFQIIYFFSKKFKKFRYFNHFLISPSSPNFSIDLAHLLRVPCLKRTIIPRGNRKRGDDNDKIYEGDKRRCPERPYSAVVRTSLIRRARIRYIRRSRTVCKLLPRRFRLWMRAMNAAVITAPSSSLSVRRNPACVTLYSQDDAIKCRCIAVAHSAMRCAHHCAILSRC